MHEAGRCPHYSRERVRLCFGADQFVIPSRVGRHSRRRGWDRQFVRQCVMNLHEGDFHKTLCHRSRTGVWLDVYRPVVDGVRLYVKFAEHERDGWFVVLSFCLDGEAH